ncbi:MAG: MarR family winged helix-turn-helix transcriptional regulator [Chloroflexia bacterium]
MSETSRDLQDHLVALIRGFGLHNPDVTPCGVPMSVSEAHTLMELADREDRTQRELAVALQLEKSTVSRLVSNLEGKGWLVRRSSPSDGRSVLLCLTNKGQRLAAKLAAARAAKFAQVATAIPEDELKAVLRALEVVVRAMSSAKSDNSAIQKNEEYENR